ncbi:hypothetical protein EW146_g4580 [Bondarzewia mesenterica]|uniref:Protein kinase domain-containing protein n=1 Tax=Bondarzewia mesenterica TaxID=1095465 RepID=A0A4S4LWA9_9AGAM|nr:hypothetical protein EW146_g4580 [Bondarzewia mesenterica]
MSLTISSLPYERIPGPFIFRNDDANCFSGPDQDLEVSGLTLLHEGNQMDVYRCTLSAPISGESCVVCKIAIGSVAMKRLRREARYYQGKLKHLQGSRIPTCHGYFVGTVDDEMVGVLVLSYCGKRVERMFSAWDPKFKSDLIDVFLEIHLAGVSHNDVAERNVLDWNGKPIVIDFEESSDEECGLKMPIEEGALKPEAAEFNCTELHELCTDLRIWKPSPARLLWHRSACSPVRYFSRTSRVAGFNAISTPFSFLPSNSLSLKPRESGLTEIRGPYYAPVTRTYLDELLSDWSDYVDGVKFAGGAFSLMPEDRLKLLIETAHKHGCYVSTGGYIERVLAASSGDFATVEKYIKTCKKLGFDVIEISSGFLSIPTQDWAEIVHLVASHGLKAKPEVGIQWGAGGDASIAELESSGTRDPKWLIDRANLFLDAGASMIMIESEGITENVKNWRTDVISAITSALPAGKIMFEAADPDVFAYHIQNQGARANLFIDHSQVVQLACLRRGIWGTGSTFWEDHDVLMV